MAPEQLLTTSAVARILNIAPDTVRLWERQGKLVAVRTTSGMRLFERVEVDRAARLRNKSIARLRGKR